MNVARGFSGLCIDQSTYCKNIDSFPVELSGLDAKRSVITDRKRSDARSTLGKLLWPAIQSRSDLALFVAHAVGIISQFTVNGLLMINKLVRRLQFVTNKPLLFPDLGGSHLWRIVCFTDALLSNNSDGSTQGGFLVFLTIIKTKKASLLSWKSCKPRRIARSTLSAETVACIDGLNESLVETIFSTKVTNDKFND